MKINCLIEKEKSWICEEIKFVLNIFDKDFVIVKCQVKKVKINN
jgi:hypothetical protein